VVDVAVCQHDSVNTWHGGCDLGTRSRRARVDQRAELPSRQTYTCQPLTRNIVRFDVMAVESIAQH
jgi:hypothetical protein